MPREIQHPSNKPLPLYVHQMNGYGAACIDILVSKDSRCVLTDLELVIDAGTIWKLTIQAERRIVDTSCPLRGEEDGMTDLVRLYLCEMRSKPGEAVVGARAVSLQRFSLGVFEFIADHSFAFVHCQVVLGNATALGSRCTKKCSSSDRRKRTIADDEHGPYHSLTRLTRQKARLL